MRRESGAYFVHPVRTGNLTRKVVLIVQTGEGIISKIYRWVWHPSQSDQSVTDWVAFLALAIIVSFLWTTVISKVD